MTDELNTTQVAEAAVAPKVKRTTILKADLTQAYVAERLELREDRVPVDGAEDEVFENFYWKVDTVASRKGDFAGSRRPVDGYYSVVLAGTNYSGKQLAGFLKTGVWPTIQRGRAGGGEAVAKEPKVHEIRTFVPLSPEARAAAKAAAAAKRAQKAVSTAAEVPAATAETSAAADTAVQASVDAADTADLAL